MAGRGAISRHDWWANPLTSDKNDLIWITFQASKEQREKLERIAEADNRTMSSWLRNQIDTTPEPEQKEKAQS